MGDWSTDKIAVTGMMLALIVSIVSGALTGREETLAASIVTGIFGYIRGVAEAEKAKDKPERPPTMLEKVSETATEAQKVIDSAEKIKDIVKK